MMYHFYESYGEESSSFVGSEICCHESQSEVPELKPICIICQCEKISAIALDGKSGDVSWLVREYHILQLEVTRKSTSLKTDGFSSVDAVKIIDTTAGMLGISTEHSEELFPLITEVVFHLCQSLRPEFLKYFVSAICNQLVENFTGGVGSCLEIIVGNRTCLEILKDLPNLYSEIVPKLLDCLRPSNNPKVILSLVRTMKSILFRKISSPLQSFYPRLVYGISEIFNDFSINSEDFHIAELLELLKNIFTSELILIACLRDKLGVFSNLFISLKKIFVVKRPELSKLALETLNKIFYTYNRYSEIDNLENLDAFNPKAFEKTFVANLSSSFSQLDILGKSNQDLENFGFYTQSEDFEEFPLPLQLFQSELIHFLDDACSATDEKLFFSIIRFYINILSIVPSGVDYFQNSLESILRFAYLKDNFDNINGKVILDFCHAVIPKVTCLKQTIQFQFVSYFEKQCRISDIEELLSCSYLLNYCNDESLRPKIWRCLQIVDSRGNKEIWIEESILELTMILNLITAYVPYCDFHAEDEGSSESLDKRFLPFIIKERFFGPILELVYQSDENIFSEDKNYGHTILKLLNTFCLKEFSTKCSPDVSQTECDTQFTETMDIEECMTYGELFLNFLEKTLREQKAIKFTSAVYQILTVFLENETSVNIGNTINLDLSCMSLSSLYTSNEHLNVLALLFQRDFHSAFITLDEQVEKEEFLKTVQGLYIHVQSLILKSSASNLHWNLLKELLSYMKRNNPSHLSPLVFDPWIPFLFHIKCSGINGSFDLEENPCLEFIHEWATIFIELVSEIDTRSREIIIGECDDIFSFASVFKFLEESLQEDEPEALCLDTRRLKEINNYYSVVMNQYLSLKQVTEAESQVLSINEKETQVIEMDSETILF